MANKPLFFFLCAMILQACSVTKHVPEGEFFLNSVEIEPDRREVRAVELRDYLQQTPNSSKLLVRLYSLGDTTNWFRRTIRRFGEPPVIFNRKTMERSVPEIQTEMINRGYLNARVKMETDTVSRKKMNVIFPIEANEPYRVRNYAIEVNNVRAQSYLDRWNQRRRKTIVPGVIFDYRILDQERDNASAFLRNIGYFTFSADNLFYLADTTLRSNQVDLTLTIRDTTGFKPYYINRIRVLSGFNPVNSRHFRAVDSTSYQGVDIFYDAKRFIRPHVLVENITLRPGQLYSERRSQQTYDLLSGLSAVDRASVEFREVATGDSTALDCDIYLSPNNIHGTELGIDGTHSAGNIGIAANVTYRHGNIFNGSEVFSVGLRGAYEFVDNSGDSYFANNYYEWGINTSLLFPKIIFPFFSHRIKRRLRANTEYGVRFDIQRRPEYTRNFLSLSWRYRWENPYRGRTHVLNLLSVNFVSMPYKSQEFLDYLNREENYLTRISYNNLFTAGAGYSGTYSNSNTRRYRTWFYTMRYGVESSGNLLSGIFSLTNAGRDENGQYNILGNPFAQYVKFDYDYSQAYRLDEKNEVAMHAAIGVAYPYGNSTVLPFEKRYFGGGPNHVRGWNTRELGPGSYSGERDISVQNGDMGLLFSLEYRYRIIPMLEFAVFSDAGNVWTLRDYDNQPGGLFQWNSFIKEMAVGAGIGFRFDFKFLIIRIDGGKKMYDPARLSDNPWVAFEGFRGNSAVYFAIGYPF